MASKPEIIGCETIENLSVSIAVLPKESVI